MQTRRKSSQVDSELVRAVRSSTVQVAEAVAQALECIPKWQAEARNYGGTRADYLALNFQVFPDYLAEYFERSDASFLRLFVGEIIKALYVPSIDDGAARDQARRVVEAMHTRVNAALCRELSARAQARLSDLLNEVSRILTADTSKVQRVLLVGDCLFLDIVPFMVTELLDSGIRTVMDFATSKNPALLRDEIRALSATKFDLVFYSPFSYEFSLEYNQLLEWKNALMGESAVRDLARRAWDDTRGTIDVLADLFDCPIHVHNSAAVVREESAAKRLIKAKATARNRSSGRGIINKLLPAYLQQKNSDSFQHLFLFDEKSLVEAFGELDAGAYLYKSLLQHPAVLGQVFGAQYVDLIYVNAWLVKKKVVVCDLDNTLWKGVIGEGPVSHYHARQAALKALKSKGVVLAINSKNDPASVNWREGTLGDADFVCAAISWAPKVQGMHYIQSALNLKVKDYVFIDDREDERELMRGRFPETLCLDANDERSWKRIGLWPQLLEQDSDMDRTLMYKQREARRAFVQEDVGSPEERARLFQSLQLRLTIMRAQSHDLKRVVDLINRTNQFNLEGSRTTFREVSAWHDSPEHLILLGQTADRFGDMGITCIAVAAFSTTEVRILPFVLSCRVFGYGVEQGVMNHLKRIARQRGAQRLIGHFQSTPQNAPCKDFLSTSSFYQDGERWSLDLNSAPTPDPPWLAVTIL